MKARTWNWCIVLPGVSSRYRFVSQLEKLISQYFWQSSFTSSLFFSIRSPIGRILRLHFFQILLQHLIMFLGLPRSKPSERQFHYIKIWIHNRYLKFSKYYYITNRHLRAWEEISLSSSHLHNRTLTRTSHTPKRSINDITSYEIALGDYPSNIARNNTPYTQISL